jgi:hypothetical protein
MAVAARVVRDAREITLAAWFDVATQGRRPAGLNRLHQLELMPREIVSLPVSGAVESKNVGQLESWPHGWLCFGPTVGLRLVFQPVQRADSRGH